MCTVCRSKAYPHRLRPCLVEHRVKPCQERIIHHTPQYRRAMIAVQPTETNAPTLRIWTTPCFAPCFAVLLFISRESHVLK